MDHRQLGRNYVDQIQIPFCGAFVEGERKIYGRKTLRMIIPTRMLREYQSSVQDRDELPDLRAFFIDTEVLDLLSSRAMAIKPNHPDPIGLRIDLKNALSNKTPRYLVSGSPEETHIEFSSNSEI